MSKDLRESWKQTGKELENAFKNLGKTLIKTGAVAVKKVDAWANSEDYASESENKQEKTEE